MLVKRKLETFQAVQFTGDPSVHSMIWLCQKPITIGDQLLQNHWRFGGENHGSSVGSSSIKLDIGDYIISSPERTWIMPEDAFKKHWEVVDLEMTDDVIDLKYYIEAVNPCSGGCHTEKDSLLFLAKDRAVPAALERYRSKSEELGANPAHLESIDLLLKRVLHYQETIGSKVPDTDLPCEIQRCLGEKPID